MRLPPSLPPLSIELVARDRFGQAWRQRAVLTRKGKKMSEFTFGSNWRGILLPLCCTIAVVGAALTYAMMS